MTSHLCRGLQARGLRSEHGARGQSRVQDKSKCDGDEETGGAEIEPIDRLGCTASFLDHALEILILLVLCARDAEGSVTKAVMRFRSGRTNGVVELRSSARKCGLLRSQIRALTAGRGKLEARSCPAKTHFAPSPRRAKACGMTND